MTLLSNKDFEREARRILARLVEPESFVRQSGPAEFALYVSQDNHRAPLLKISERIWLGFERRDLVERSEKHPYTEWILSATGRAYWRRLENADQADPFRAQHQLAGTRMIMADGKAERVATNDAETPLVWLYRRKGKNGKSLISEDQLEAGERLRRDHMLADLGSRVTTNWSFELGVNIEGGRLRDPAEVTDMALAARERLAAALKFVGRGLSNPLLEVCCNQSGLEEIEKQFGWPQRSAKVVLQIGLDRLAEFYTDSGVMKPRARAYAPAPDMDAAASLLTRSTIE
ncbi:MAG: DUF6456 domain-containing protein [Pseudomonadota bacterium]